MAFRADARLIFTSTTDVLPSGCGEINAFAAPFHTKKTISLPRQARDKHRESTQKRRERRFFAGDEEPLPSSVPFLTEKVIRTHKNCLTFLSFPW
jgi:hypothetical protein